MNRSTNNAPESLSTSYLIGSAFIGISITTLKSSGRLRPGGTRSRLMVFLGEIVVRRPVHWRLRRALRRAPRRAAHRHSPPGSVWRIPAPLRENAPPLRCPGRSVRPIAQERATWPDAHEDAGSPADTCVPCPTAVRACRVVPGSATARHPADVAAATRLHVRGVLAPAAPARAHTRRAAVRPSALPARPRLRRRPHGRDPLD